MRPITPEQLAFICNVTPVEASRWLTHIPAGYDRRANRVRAIHSFINPDAARIEATRFTHHRVAIILMLTNPAQAQRLMKHPEAYKSRKMLERYQALYTWYHGKPCQNVQRVLQHAPPKPRAKQETRLPDDYADIRTKIRAAQRTAAQRIAESRARYAALAASARTRINHPNVH